MRSLRFILALGALCCIPALISAQSFSFGASGVYAALNGDDFAGINSGIGFDAQMRYHPKGKVSFGGGFQYTSHGIEGFSEHFSVTGFFIDPRYTFSLPASPKVSPYVGMRVAYAHWKVSSGGSSLTANGTAFGPGGGLLVKLSPNASLDVGLLWLVSVHFGNADLDGSEQPDTKSSGSAMGLRAGFQFGFGQKN